MKIFEEVTGLDKLNKMIVTKSNLNSNIQQHGRIFKVAAKEMKAFIGITTQITSKQITNYS